MLAVYRVPSILFYDLKVPGALHAPGYAPGARYVPGMYQSVRVRVYNNSFYAIVNKQSSIAFLDRAVYVIRTVEL